MSEFKSFNFFVGANNAGKSTVLNFISSRLPVPGHGRPAGQHNVDPLEKHGGAAGRLPRMAFNEEANTLKQHIQQLANDPATVSQRDIGIIVDELADPQGYVWIEAPIDLSVEFKLRVDKPIEHFVSILDHPSNWLRLWTNLARHTGGNITSHWIPGVLEYVQKAIAVRLPTTRLVPAIRQIAADGPDPETYSGAGLISRLARIQSPDFDHREDRKKFDQINAFLQTVTDRPAAQIEVPHSRNHLLVHMDGKVLPLSSLGTGIHEVVMLAAFCTISEEEILCIEEPELHLHPLLQRKLISYLRENTTNQYFIATHSASFIDTPGSAVYHVRLEGTQTRIRQASLAKERHAICVDLGHKASDIVQANAVIWVEGPSDRVYLNHWIRSINNDLREGTHYSVMFYGGRLLSHLTAEDEEVSEFIELRALNRNLAVIMDSDKASPHHSVNATKQRVKRELESGGGFAWITKGREVENYINHATLQSAVATVVGKAYGSPLQGGPYDHALHYQRAARKRTRSKARPGGLRETVVDKVKVAKEVVKVEADLNVLDLRLNVGRLVALIQKANL